MNMIIMKKKEDRNLLGKRRHTSAYVNNIDNQFYQKHKK